LVEVIADKLACPLRAGRLGSREQLEQAPLAIEHGNHGLAVKADRGDPEHLTLRNTPEADGGSANLPQAIWSIGMDPTAPLDPRRCGDNLLM